MAAAAREQVQRGEGGEEEEEEEDGEEGEEEEGEPAYPIDEDGHAIVPDGEIALEDSAFWGCSALTAVALPDSLTAIDRQLRLRGLLRPHRRHSARQPHLDRQMLLPSALNAVTLPDSLTSIGDYAFRGCSALTAVSLPDSLTSIGEFAFWLCSALTAVTLPDRLPSIGNGAFRDCPPRCRVGRGSADHQSSRGVRGAASCWSCDKTPIEIPRCSASAQLISLRNLRRVRDSSACASECRVVVWGVQCGSLAPSRGGVLQLRGTPVRGANPPRDPCLLYCPFPANAHPPSEG